MGDNMNTSAGGLHPGRPVIWPTGKSAQTAQTPQSTSSVTAQSAQSSQSAAKTAPTPQEVAQAQAALKIIQQQTSRQFTQADLKALLIQQNIPETEANEKLATVMLRYGLEVSKANVSKLNTMTGTDQSQTMQEASILLLMKGIESPAAAKTLSKFLSENPQLASQIMSLKGNVADLLAALNLGKDIMSQQMIGKLSAVLTQFVDTLDDLPGNYKFSGKGSTGRAELANDLRALKSMLDGMPEKQNLPDSAEGQIIDSNIKSTSNRLDQMIQGLISQALLSKQSQRPEVNYSYYQIPNAMAKPMTTVDLIVKRSDAEGGKKIDPKDTEIIMSFDTENMGRIAVKMSIKDKNVDIIFNTQTDAAKSLVANNTKELANALLDKDFTATKMQVNVNPSMCTIKPFLIPFLGIEDLMKVDVSA
jgi:hypothetical protein